MDGLEFAGGVPGGKFVGEASGTIRMYYNSCRSLEVEVEAILPFSKLFRRSLNEFIADLHW